MRLVVKLTVNSCLDYPCDAVKLFLISKNYMLTSLLSPAQSHFHKIKEAHYQAKNQMEVSHLSDRQVAIRVLTSTQAIPIAELEKHFKLVPSSSSRSRSGTCPSTQEPSPRMKTKRMKTNENKQFNFAA